MREEAQRKNRAALDGAIALPDEFGRKYVKSGVFSSSPITEVQPQCKRLPIAAKLLLRLRPDVRWLALAGDNRATRHHSFPRHPGPYHATDAELVGLPIAVGFVVMGLVAFPIVKWFLIAALLLGGGVALLLRFSRKQ